MDIINRGTLPDFIFLSFIFSAFLKIKIEQEKKESNFITYSLLFKYSNLLHFWLTRHES